MKITVGFSRARDWWLIGSQLIKTSESRPYSHVFIRYTSQSTGMEIVAQASHGCINLMNYDRFLTVNTLVKEYSFEISEDEFKFMLNYIESNLGTTYSKVQIVLLGIKKLLGIEVNIHNKDAAFICSEFIARILEVVGVLTQIDDADYLTPSDLDTILETHVNK